MPTPASILLQCRLFSNLQPPQLSLLQNIAILHTYAANTLIFRQGQVCPGVYIVGTGLVRVFQTSPQGKEHVLHLVPPGGTFAEVAALGNFPCPAFAESLEETTCALLPAPAFRKALESDHPLCLQLLGSMAGWVKHLVGLVEDISLRDAAGRLARYLLTHAHPTTGIVELPSLKKHLASQLNLTSETLSRTLRRLIDSGALEMAGDTLIVRQPAILEQLTNGEGPLI